jgi:hypothetical protein
MAADTQVLPRWRQALYHAGCMIRHAGLALVELWKTLTAFLK